MRDVREGREGLIRDTFVELADTLASGYDVAEFLHLLVERCQRALDVTAGGVLLASGREGLTLAAATSEKMEQLEAAEMRHGEGPCVDAYRNVEQVVAEDLDEAHDRWPNATREALRVGFRAVCALPLRVRVDCIGALNLYRERPGPFRESDVRLAQAFADVAAIGILQERQVTAAEKRAAQLQEALTSRVVIEQAKGVLMGVAGVSADEAFAALRSHARRNQMKLRELAARIVETDGAGLDGILRG